MTADGVSVPSEAVEWVCRSIRSADSCPAAIVRERPGSGPGAEQPAVSRQLSRRHRQRDRGCRSAAASSRCRSRRPGRSGATRDCPAAPAPAPTTAGVPASAVRKDARSGAAADGVCIRPAGRVAAEPLTCPDAMSCARRWFSRSMVVDQPSNVLASTVPALAPASSSRAQFTPSPASRTVTRTVMTPEAPASPMS